MSGFGILKSVTELMVSTGTGVIVGNAIRATTPPITTNIKVIRVFNQASASVAGIVVSGMLGDMASKYATGRLDDLHEQYNKFKSAASDIADDVKDA